MNLYLQIQNATTFTHNEKVVADYLLENPECFKLSVNELCKACYVSEATVYRFCRKLGFDGFAKLQVALSCSLDGYLESKKEFDFDYPIQHNQTNYEIMKSLKEDYAQTSLSTLELFDLNTIGSIVSLMKEACQIDVYTSAGNLYFAQNFRFQMQEIGITVNVPEDEYLQRITASSSNSQHLAFIISFGGRGAVMQSIAKLLKKNHTPIVLITSTQENPMYKYATHKIYMCSSENHYNKISSFATRFSLLYIFDCLYTCYFKMDYEKNKKCKLQYYQNMVKAYLEEE